MRRVLRWLWPGAKWLIAPLVLLIGMRLWLDLVLPGNWARFIALGAVLGWMLLRERREKAL